MGKIDYDRWLDRRSTNYAEMDLCGCAYCIGNTYLCQYPSTHSTKHGHDIPDGYCLFVMAGAKYPYTEHNTFLAPAECLKKTTITRPDTGITGHRCNRCKSFNEYAAANRPDGTYVCYECR